MKQSVVEPRTEPTVEVSTVISAGRDEVWHALTTPELIRRYFLGADVETDWKPGHEISFDGEWKGRTFHDRGEIQTYDEGRELSYSHWSEPEGAPVPPESRHLVRFLLEPAREGTRVTLQQSDPGRREPLPEQARAEYRKNWETMLAGLKDLVEHGIAQTS